jgi:thioredoxin-related protein
MVIGETEAMARSDFRNARKTVDISTGESALLILLVAVSCLVNGCSCTDDRVPYIIIDTIWDESNRRINESVEPADSNVFFVTKYDPDRNPFEDLQAAASLAQAENKRIILVVGGNWCLPCIKVARFWAETESIRERLISNFVVVKVNYGPLNQNERFLSQFHEIIGFPHIFVLDSDGRTLLPPVEGTGFSLFDEEIFPTRLDSWALEKHDAR